MKPGKVLGGGARLSAVLTGFFPESVRDAGALAGAIGLSADAGFDCVEFYHEGPGCRAAAAALRDSGLSSVFLAAYPMKRDRLDLGARDPAERRKAVDAVKGWIDAARACGSEAVMLLSGPEIEDEAERDLAVRRLAESLVALCGFAADGPRPLRVHLESFNNRGEPFLLIGPVSRCVELADAIGRTRDNFGMTFDLSHSLQLGEDPAESLALLGGRCRHVHLANCVIRDRADPLFGDKHPHFGLRGGEVDVVRLAGFLSFLRASGFLSGGGAPAVVGLEIISRPPEVPAEALRRAKADFDAAWGGGA